MRFMCYLESTVLSSLLWVFLWYCVFFFFFQAEDGIRDLTVTGVQTCALPISRSLSAASVACSTVITCATESANAVARAVCTLSTTRMLSAVTFKRAICVSFAQDRKSVV